MIMQLNLRVNWSRRQIHHQLGQTLAVAFVYMGITGMITMSSQILRSAQPLQFGKRVHCGSLDQLARAVAQVWCGQYGGCGLVEAKKIRTSSWFSTKWNSLGYSMS
jgi:hypothetical protein